MPSKAPFPFRSAEEHAAYVAMYGYHGGTPNARATRQFPCAECGRYFVTTDWPPAVCQECRH
ncbi:MAG: hypothetical protein KGL39_58130 [Patescibacteria group bacterium]|nr:hypothetical protein [Patescibacteria group bacterium]